MTLAFVYGHDTLHGVQAALGRGNRHGAGPARVRRTLGVIMRTLLPWFGLACLAAALTGLPGCSGDSDDTSTVVTNSVTNAASATLSGSWVGTIAQGGGVPGNISMGISQNGDTLTGTYQGTGGVIGTMAGTVDGNTVTMTTTAGAVVAEWSGLANSDRDAMSGTFTIIAGGGGNGTWALVKQ